MVLRLLEEATAACPPGAAATLGGPAVHGVPSPVLAKEAVYQAVAVGAYELHDHVDLHAWLHGGLLAEMADPAPAARPLRRRALKLVSYWTSKLQVEDRPAVYRALVGALGDPDAALQLVAVVSLQALVTDW